MVQYRAHDKIVKKISEALNKDIRVVAAICRHSSEFKAKVIRDPKDKRPIRDRYLGILAIIKGKEKK